MKEQTALLARLYRLAGPGFPRHAATALLAGLAPALHTLVMANALRDVFAAAAQGSQGSLSAAILVFAASIAGFFLYNCVTWGFFVASTVRVTGRIRKALFAHLCGLPLGELEAGGSASVATLFTSDVPAAESAYGHLLRYTIASALCGMTAAAVLIGKNPAMGLAVLGTGLAQLACNLLVVKPLQRLCGRIAGKIEEANAALTAMLDGNVTIRLYGMQRRMAGEYGRKSRELSGLNVRLATLEGIIRGSNVLAGMGGYLAILALGAWMASAGSLDLAGLIYMTQIRGLVMLVVFSVGDFAQAAQPALASASRIFAFLDKPAEKQQDRAVQ